TLPQGNAKVPETMRGCLVWAFALSFGDSLMHRRARLLGVFVAVMAVALMLAGTHYSSASSSSALIARGSFSGVSWRLTGNSWRDGSYCLNMKIPATSKSVGSGGCGSIHVPGRYGPHGIGYLAHAGLPLPGYVVGPVVAKGRIVEIRLSNGDALRATTIAPPPTL